MRAQYSTAVVQWRRSFDEWMLQMRQALLLVMIRIGNIVRGRERAIGLIMRSSEGYRPDHEVADSGKWHIRMMIISGFGERPPEATSHAEGQCIASI